MPGHCLNQHIQEVMIEMLLSRWDESVTVLVIQLNSCAFLEAFPCILVGFAMALCSLPEWAVINCLVLKDMWSEPAGLDSDFSFHIFFPV